MALDGRRDGAEAVAGNASRSSTRVLIQSWPARAPQSVNTLTLSPAAVIVSKRSNSTSQARPSYTRWRTSYAGSTSSVTRVSTPSAPSPTTSPSKSASPRRTVRSSPSEVMSSSAATAVARLPLASPDPCVAVAIAPATAMCGSDARFPSASPCASQRRGELAVAQACRERHLAGVRVDADVRGQRVEREQLGGVGDVAERVPRPERPHARRARDELLRLLDRRRPMQPLGPIRVRPGPVRFAHATTLPAPTGGAWHDGRVLPNESPVVAEFMRELSHPLKAGIVDVRAAILASDAAITEQVKWSAPSFCYHGDDRVTLRLQPGDRLELVLHRGAKKRDDAGELRFDDSAGLVEWAAPDRGIVSLRDLDDVRAKLPAVVELVGRWMRATT